MNMLGNRVQYFLLTGDEKRAFNKIGKQGCEYLTPNESWHTQSTTIGTFRDDGVYRLELKNDEWYYYELKGRDEPHIYKCTKYFNPDVRSYSVFRPATQEEIDSVQPKAKFIEVDIEWYKNGGEVKVPNGEIVQLEELRKNFPIGNCIFLGFFFEGTKAINAFPVIVDNYNEYSSFEITKRASKARFIEVG